MLIKEIIDKIKKDGLFDVYSVEYKRQEDKDKYGDSFDTTLKDKDFAWVKVNGGTFKCKRIVEEFGQILFIYNGEQISYKPQDIQELETNIKE